MKYQIDTIDSQKADSVYVLVTRAGARPAEFVFDFAAPVAPYDAGAVAVYHQPNLRTIQRESRRSYRERPRGAIGAAFKAARALWQNKSV